MSKYNYLTLLLAVLLISLFLLSRLLNLQTLPVFVDEGLHISWAQQMLATGDFLHGVAAGKFLHTWLLALILSVTESPVLVSRILSAVIGLVSGLTTLVLARTIWPRHNLTWTVAFIYLVTPLCLMHERLALVDGLLTLLSTLALIFSIKLLQQPGKLISVVLGLCLGLAYLTKLSGFIYWTIPILSFIFLKSNLSSIKFLVLTYGVAVLVALPTALELPNQFLYEAAVRSVFNPVTSQISTNQWQLYGLGEIWVSLSRYITWPILLLAATRLCYGLWQKERLALLLAALLLLTPATYLLLAKDFWYSRYLFPIVPIIIVLAACTLTDLALLLTHNKSLQRVWLVVLSFLVLLPGLIFDYHLITHPEKTPFTPIDRWQYITGWPSGYGLAEVVTYLHQEIGFSKEDLVVITGTHPGPPQEGLRLYLGNHEPDIDLVSVDLQKASPQTLQEVVQAQTKPTLLLLNEPLDKNWNSLASPCPETLAVFQKPEHKSWLTLKSCQTAP